MTYYRHLTDDLNHSDEAGYRIEDGVIVDVTERKADYYTKASRYYYYPGREEKHAEELAWAARSGPVTVYTKGN